MSLCAVILSDNKNNNAIVFFKDQHHMPDYFMPLCMMKWIGKEEEKLHDDFKVGQVRVNILVHYVCQLCVNLTYTYCWLYGNISEFLAFCLYYI